MGVCTKIYITQLPPPTKKIQRTPKPQKRNSEASNSAISNPIYLNVLGKHQLYASTRQHVALPRHRQVMRVQKLLQQQRQQGATL